MSLEAPLPRAGPADEVVAIGAGAQLAVLDLAGARTFPAEDEDAVRAAWRGLPAGVAVVVLTEAAADAVGADRLSAGAPLTVVLPA